MNDEEVTKFDSFWWTITRKENFIREYGTFDCPNWEDKWHQDLEDAYSNVRLPLVPVTRRRMFHGLPGDLNPFQAENYHHALVLVLNPPELWLGNIGILRSPEYLALKRGAEDEERSLAQAHPVAVFAKVPAELFNGLNDTACDILQAMDDKLPQSWKEIAKRAGYSYDKVRQYSSFLKAKSLIMKSRRGFVRLVPLPDKCDAL